MYIKNCRNSNNIKPCSPIEHCRKLENKCFEIGNFSYTHRCKQAKNISKNKFESLKSITICEYIYKTVHLLKI